MKLFLSFIFTNVCFNRDFWWPCVKIEIKASYFLVATFGSFRYFLTDQECLLKTMKVLWTILMERRYDKRSRILNSWIRLANRARSPVVRIFPSEHEVRTVPTFQGCFIAFTAWNDKRRHLPDLNWTALIEVAFKVISLRIYICRPRSMQYIFWRFGERGSHYPVFIRPVFV